MELTLYQEDAAWFCLLSKRKQEYVAAAQLAERHKLRVFAPRVRFRRPAGEGLRWATEALFPGYFFAKVNWLLLRRVHYAPQVRGIVHFGNYWPIVPDQTIEELEHLVGAAPVHEIAPEIAAGDEVKIMEGTLRGFEAVVKQVMPARERVAVLLDFLGRQTVVEMSSGAILKNVEQRQLAFKAA